MGIRLRGSTWWADYTTPSGKRVRCSLETGDKKSAQELYDQLKAGTWRQERLGDKPDRTFDEAALRWLREKSGKKSLDDDKSKIRYFLTYFGGRSLAGITADEIKAAVSELIHRRGKGKGASRITGQPVTDSTRNHYLTWMRSLMRRAQDEWGWLDKAPALAKAKTPNRRIRWLTKDEAARLIECAPPHLAAIIRFALATGLRRSNIINLEWSQVDLQRRVAWIHPDQAKAGRAIGVALNDSACAVISEQLGRHRRFVFTYEGRLMRLDANTAWRASLRRAGITDFRFHDLRHTWASWLVQAGVPLSALQEMGGWESIEMVRRYAHLAPAHLGEHAKRLDSILGGFGTNPAQTKKGSDVETV